MSVHVLHHGRCFDGAGSAAVFAAFYRKVIDPRAKLTYIAKRHRVGDPFEPEDFACDVAACLDFRYSQDPRLRWYFDHHRSAFQLPGDREHFDADASGLKFHDAGAPSCTGYIAKVCHERFGFDASAHAELIRWADIIDTAAFPDPHTAVAMDTPAMRLAAFIQSAEGPETICAFIEDLQRIPFAQLAHAKYICDVVEPRIARHHDDVAVIARESAIESGVLHYDILEHGQRVFSHFIPYHAHPEIRYVVGIYRHNDGDVRLTVGYNPWLAADQREHDLARLCEAYGGGGHPFVAGCSFPDADADYARRVQREMVARLCGIVGT
jgi:hypothetical protein